MKLTEDQAIELAESKFWEDMTHEERAKFQLFQDRLCMPFEVFHEAIEKALGRSVWTHEFGLNHEGLKKELLGDSDPPSLVDIMMMVPVDKRVIVSV